MYVRRGMIFHYTTTSYTAATIARRKQVQRLSPPRAVLERQIICRTNRQLGGGGAQRRTPEKGVFLLLLLRCAVLGNGWMGLFGVEFSLPPFLLLLPVPSLTVNGPAAAVGRSVCHMAIEERKEEEEVQPAKLRVRGNSRPSPSLTAVPVVDGVAPLG